MHKLFDILVKSKFLYFIWNVLGAMAALIIVIYLFASYFGCDNEVIFRQCYDVWRNPLS